MITAQSGGVIITDRGAVIPSGRATIPTKGMSTMILVVLLVAGLGSVALDLEPALRCRPAGSGLR